MKQKTVSVEWLKDNLNRNGLIILDASLTRTVNKTIPYSTADEIPFCKTI